MNGTHQLHLKILTELSETYISYSYMDKFKCVKLNNRTRAPTSSILLNFISCKIVLTNMTFYLLDLIRNCADQPSINKLISPTNSPNFTPQLVLCCSVHFPTQPNIRHTVILLTVFLVAASNGTD